MAEIIDGKKIAAEVRAEVAERAGVLIEKGVQPGLAVILVGDDPASASYVKSKQNSAGKARISSTVHRLSATTGAEELAGLIDDLNADPSVHGILLQLPLPQHLSSDAFINRIQPTKDVDGLHPVSVGLLAQGRPRFVPCTPAGVQEMLRRTGVDVAGSHVVIVGRSNLVGRPLSLLLSNKAETANATVTLCHTGTRDLPSFTRQADILVVAAGRPGAVGAQHVSPGTVVIDVGINRVEETGKLVGDVDYAAVEPIASAITPVPGGVGPMTVAMLLSNTVDAAEATLAG